ncbi:GAF and ANTAR domain-containing protein [Auraticoccus monumenti]|uniref:GAF domain-containing protein n=1 Tax=Auraticoccus monumenti TaxID=675864 RepID=A0A1G6ZBZ6_9ACTN|nr:GAF and ANTAR domain-containing protein [Auraticoccus monumenti]SDE00002.1 hypothetical protein SAMN04489747_2244 [Auraticoccus monumenti]
MLSDLGQVFQRELGREPGSSNGGVTPTELTRAAVRSLGCASGAGVTLFGAQLPVPLGASSDEVMRAELIQATLGDGPCLDAARRGSPVLVDQAGLSRDWPVYHEQLVAQTSLRAVVVLPLGGEEGIFAALSIYTRRSSFTDLPPLEVVNEGIGAQVGEALLSAPAGPEEVERSEALTGDGERHRTRVEVWRAVAGLMAATDLSSDDALAVLRGYALTHDLSIDRLGQQLISREVTTSDVLDC